MKAHTDKNIVMLVFIKIFLDLFLKVKQFCSSTGKNYPFVIKIFSASTDIKLLKCYAL